jgi:photosystem II stability/assembly factor-like uncharacterized protein
MKIRLRYVALRSIFVFLSCFMLASPALGQGPEVVLYQEDFNGGQAKGWELESGWTVASGVLVGEGHRWARYRGGEWSNFRFRFRLRIVTGDLHANYRLNNASRYYVGLYGGNSALNKQYFPDTFFNGIASSRIVLSRGAWHNIEIAGQGARITVLADGATILDYTDPQPILSGSIAFETLDNSKVEVDDITIIGPAPTPTPTPPKGYTWIRTGGPLGGLGYDVRMRPDNPDVLFVTDAWAGVHKSTDGGKTWFPANDGIVTRTSFSGDAIPIFCLTIDPRNYDIVWAGTQDTRGIFKSTDGGKTWVEKDKGVVEGQGITFRGFTIDPRSSSVVYAAAEISSFVWAGKSISGREFDLTKGVVYKTTDGGENWSAVWRGDNLARYIWIDPRNPDTLYVSTGIFDREAANSDHTKNSAGGVGIVKSTDGGRTWRQVNNGLKNLYIGTLFMHPTSPDILLAGAGNNAYPSGSGVYLTTNGGETWTQVLDTRQDAVTSVEFATTNPNIAYAGGDGAVHRSEDSGRTWRQMIGSAWGPPGARVGFPIDFQVDPRDANRLFANAYGGGNFVTTDGGKTWQIASQGYTGAEMNAVMVDPTDAATIYAGARSGFFKSSNGGATWQPINYPPADTLREGAAGAIDPSNPQHVLVADQQDGHIWASSDGGQNWREVLNQARQIQATPTNDNNVWFQGVNAMVFAPSDPRIVYAGFAVRWCVFFNNPPYCAVPSQGIFRSSDGGATWQAMDGMGLDRVSILALAVHPTNSNVVYAATGGKGIMKSGDGGKTWVAANQGIASPYARAIVLDPSNPQVLYAGTEGAALFKSTDGGATWKQSSVGLDPNAIIRAIAIDPRKPTTLYAGDLRSGMYLSEDGGARWVQINNRLRMRAVRGLAISADGKHVYAGMNGEGVFRLDVGGEPLAIKIAPSPTFAPTQPLVPTQVIAAATMPAVPTVPPVIPPIIPIPTIPSGSQINVSCCGSPIEIVPLVLVGLFFTVRARRRRKSS